MREVAEIVLTALINVVIERIVADFVIGAVLMYDVSRSVQFSEVEDDVTRHIDRERCLILIEDISVRRIRAAGDVPYDKTYGNALFSRVTREDESEAAVDISDVSGAVGQVVYTAPAVRKP